MLNGKVIVVTGAGRGIGRACAEIFARDGARVVVSDVLADIGAETVAAITAAGGEAMFVEADVASETDISRLLAATLDRYGRIDGAVNNAAIAMHGAVLTDIPREAWDRLIAINLTGVFLCMQQEIRAMTPLGGGAIVNISSPDGLVARPSAADYGASKHGVIGLTKVASTEFRQTRVRVNAVLPGLTYTDMIKDILDDPTFAPQVEKIAERHSIDRRATTEDIGQACRWLLSDYASYVNGVSLPVDGGYLAR